MFQLNRFLDGSGVLESSYLQSKLTSLNEISNTALAHMVTKNVNDKLHLLMRTGKKHSKNANFFIHMVGYIAPKTKPP